MVWRPKDARRSAREQLLHELSRNGEVAYLLGNNEGERIQERAGISRILGILGMEGLGI